MDRCSTDIKSTASAFKTASLHLSRWGWTVGSLLAIVAVGFVDYITGPEITFSVFYLIPVAAAAWRSGALAAVSASALAAIAWLYAELATSRLDANTFVYTWNFCSRLLFLLLVALLLARLRKLLDQERNLSRTDALTGLPNARALRETAFTEITRAQRYGQPLSLAFIDVDNFKQVNDSRGHRAGDRLLKYIATVLRANLRSSDFVARYGGDEFVIVLPSAEEHAARSAMDKLRDKVGEAMASEGWPITLSIGVVTHQLCGSTVTVDAMLDSADRLMYDIKSGGKSDARFETVNHA